MLDERKITHDEFYRMADVNNDGDMSTLEMKEVIASIDQTFQEKELHSIFTYFDVDRSGSITEDEFMDSMKRISKSFEAY
tara:strand:+ start:1388 stop:1627 length:240 start_codon:yes stop_codon:yes gene_type:complete